jgi:NAD(P)-dependent dehydrogenase (short-subunit alcohol dehydrogenase family)
MTENRWTTNDIGNLSGKSAIVTGANSGIGVETAKALAAKGASVALPVRCIEKGKQACAEIKKEFPDASVEVMELDLSSLASIKNFVDAYSQKHERVDILVNNAGVMVPPYSKTEDGFELQFGTNHLGHFALTGLLLPLLLKSEKCRIVNVSSIAHRSGNINFDDLNWEEREYNAMQAYGDSKIANLYFTSELAKLAKDTGITVASSHPGWTRTNLQKNHMIFRMLNPIFSQKPPMGALPTLRAATSDSVANEDFYGPSGLAEVKGYPIKVHSIPLAKDAQIAEKLWGVSEKLTGVKYRFE